MGANGIIGDRGKDDHERNLRCQKSRATFPLNTEFNADHCTLTHIYDYVLTMDIYCRADKLLLFVNNKLPRGENTSDRTLQQISPPQSHPIQNENGMYNVVFKISFRNLFDPPPFNRQERRWHGTRISKENH
jgi:hypothetical protein